jgi:uncharacterized protein (DUF305 family)
MTKLRSTLLATAIAAILAAGSPAMAQQAGQHQHGQTAAPKPAGDSPSNAAYKASHDKMMKGMEVPLTGNADVDFVRNMIPHHQGAIDMAEVELAHGKNPTLKKLARKIIADQKKEIAQMEAWLKKNAQ